MGFDDRFIRMWEYYLSLSEAGFATGLVQDQQIVFEKASRTRVIRGRQPNQPALGRRLVTQSQRAPRRPPRKGRQAGSGPDRARTRRHRVRIDHRTRPEHQARGPTAWRALVGRLDIRLQDNADHDRRSPASATRRRSSPAAAGRPQGSGPRSRRAARRWRRQAPRDRGVARAAGRRGRVLIVAGPAAAMNAIPRRR